MKNIKKFFSAALSVILFYCCSLLTVSAEEMPPQSIPIFDIEAEDCTLTGCTVNNGDDYGSDFTGSGFVEYIDQIGDSVSFVVTGFTGYALMSIRYSQGMSTDQTLSLFINSKFVRKIKFEPTDTWDDTWDTIDVPCYMASGQTVTLKYTHGDGYVDIDSISCRPRAGDTAMVIVPHEDDEIFAFCGSMQLLYQNASDVIVVLMTNGDWYGLDYGRGRILETVTALHRIGIPKENIIILGYGDGLLSDLYNNTAYPNQIIYRTDDDDATYGNDHTYGNYTYNMYDYHTLQTGYPAGFTRNNLVNDLTNIITCHNPSKIFVTSEYDNHADHQATYYFVTEIINSTGIEPILNESIIHGSVANWPVPYEVYHPRPTPTPFTSPFPENNEPYRLQWSNATKIQLTPEMLCKKYCAICAYESQNASWASYNFSFYRSDEFYWSTDYSV